MRRKSERLTVLSEAEQFALYGMPDFDDGQQQEYLSLTEAELALACSRPGLHAQAYCALQIGYFKAKHAFFRFTWDDAPAILMHLSCAKIERRLREIGGKWRELPDEKSAYKFALTPEEEAELVSRLDY